MRIIHVCITSGLVLGVAGSARAADFYVDPANGSPGGDGSEGDPWRTIQEVVDAGLIESQSWDGANMVSLNPGAPVKAGDTLWLRSGFHGALSISNYHNTDDITIAAEAGETPQLSNVSLRAVSSWTLRGLTISPEFAPEYTNDTIVQLRTSDSQGPLEDVTVASCTIFSVADASGWGASDWDTLSASGMQVDGVRMTIRDNVLTNVNFGVSVTATESLIEGNVVDGFAGDGYRALGDYTTFQYNTVKNCYDVNDNHDDGFQSWSVGDGGVGTGAVTGVVLRGNTVINYEDPNQPMRCTLQGIGLFDGMFVDWVVENNVVITDHWHGITFLGADNVRVVNNTVLDPNTEDPGPPWIMVDAHKDGRPPTGCVVRNNLATSFASAEEGVTEDHNMEIDDPAALFVDVAAYDVHLLETAPAVDAGSADGAPDADRDQYPRPYGDAVDIGAYEWHPEDDPGGTSGTDGDGGTGSGGGTGTGGDGGSSGGTGPGGTGSDDSGEETGGQASDDKGCGCATRATPPLAACLWPLALLAARRRRLPR